jgi:RHS repeat-associated protein
MPWAARWTAVERNGPNPETDWYRTRSTYDIRGNLLTVTDALGREAFRYVYDLTPKGDEEDSGAQVLRIESIDAGVRRVVFDAVGNEVERRDSKGALILQSYDALHRPTHLWARDKARERLTLREQLVYGDDPEAKLTEDQIAQGNLLGQLYQHCDEAGRLTFETYDFKGNGLEKVRQVIRDNVLQSGPTPSPGLPPPTFRVDWAVPNAARRLLEDQDYRTSARYDALNRVKQMRYPEDVKGQRQRLIPTYNRAGALEQVQLNDDLYVERIAYNAKGQRVLIAYGNGVMTRYAYDPQTFRLVRLQTDAFSDPGGDPLTYHPQGAPIQDLSYDYDLTGNILRIRDRTPNSGIPGTPHALNRDFTYDPIYRLLTATGRECDRPPEPPPWVDQPRCMDLTRTRAYREDYRYDPAGNMVRRRHEHTLADGSVQGRNREFELVSNGAAVALNNQLAKVTLGQTEIAYVYDENGNLTNEGDSRNFEWDHSDQLRSFRTQANAAEPSEYAVYLYDASGQRVKKLVRNQGGQVRVTVYIDGVFEHRYVQAGRAPRRENSTLHVMDDQQRIALVRVGEALETADRSPAVQYHLGDHLGSSAVVMDGAGKLINREEFLPFGETSFGSFKWKRYRFTGKERDEESGLYFHGARYYAPWLMRWTKPDSLEDSDEFNLYAYVRNNPINRIDPKGKESLIVTGTANNVKERQQFFNSAIREAYSLNKKGFENITIIAFKHGFSDKQLNTMKLISEKAGAKFIAIDSANMLLNYINFGGLTEANTSDFNNREVNKIENVAIFTHGLPGRLAFGYLTKKQIEYTFSFEHVDRLKKEAFASGDDYEFTSFSCRTGAKSDTDFGRNLAQKYCQQD